jgi:hypothetical protein
MRNSLFDSIFLTVVILGVAALLRVGWLVSQWDEAYAGIPDSCYYFHGAVNLAEGKGYIGQNGKPVTHWPIGYSAVLAPFLVLTGPRVGTVYVFNAVVSWAGLLLLWVLALRLTGSRRVANLSALIALALLWDQLFNITLVQSESLYLLLVLVGFLAMTAPRLGPAAKGVSTGLVFGAACHVRPEAILIPGAYLGAEYLLRRPRPVWPFLKTLAGVYLVMAIVVAPWTIRVSRLAGRPCFMSSASSEAFFHANNPYAEGLPGGFDLIRKLVPEGMTPGEYAFRYIVQHPGHYLRLMPKKLAALFVPEHGASTPTDSMIIQRLPREGLTQDEYERMTGEGGRGNAVRKAWLRDRLEFDARLSHYVPKAEMTDLERSTFIHFVLLDASFDFPTPPGFVYLRLIHKGARWLLIGMLGFSLLLLLSSKHIRERWLAYRPITAVTITAAVMMLPYILIYSGCNRYAYPILPFLAVSMSCVWVAVRHPPGEDTKPDLKKG